MAVRIKKNRDSIKWKVRHMVMTMPPDLVHDLAELERRGELEPVLERAIGVAVENLRLRRLTTRLFLREIRPLFATTIAKLSDPSTGTYQMTVRSGTSDATRFATDRRVATV